jgi:hypothetical protein
MERKCAMAVAATVTCVLGSSAVALAATVGSPVLGFGRGHPAAASAANVWETSAAQQARRVITRTKDVVDKVVVDVPVATAASVTPSDVPGATVIPVSEPATSTNRPRRTSFRPRRTGSSHRDRNASGARIRLPPDASWPPVSARRRSSR